MKTFQDYWDRQIKRLEKYKTPMQMNEMFDECSKAFESGFQICKYLKNQCDCEPFQSCEKCKTEWRDPNIDKPKHGIEYWILFKDDQISRSRFHNAVGWMPYGNKLSNKNFMFAEIKPPPKPV